MASQKWIRQTAEGDMSWQEFMELGRNFKGEYITVTKRVPIQSD